MEIWFLVFSHFFLVPLSPPFLPFLFGLKRMTSFLREFIIPSQPEALVSASGTQPPEDRHYVSSGLVSEIEGYTAKMLETTVSRVGHVLKRDPMTILQGEYFDQLYSVLRSWPHLEPD